MAPELLDALNRVHHAARAGGACRGGERAEVFETSLLFEQEPTVGPKVREEVAKFDCPVLTAIVLRPIVRFGYFPRSTFMLFHDFGNTDERIEKAVRSYELAETAGWNASPTGSACSGCCRRASSPTRPPTRPSCGPARRADEPTSRRRAG